MLQFNNERVATHTNGEDIYLFKLTNSKNTQVGITNYGAIIQSFVIQNKDGALQDIVLGFDDVSRYMDSDYYSKDYPYLGAVIGRYGNRIGHARFPVHGHTIQVSPNFDPHQLHGGYNGFDKKVWKPLAYETAPVPRLVLQHISPDGDEGYPGNLTTHIEFILSDDNELTYTITATTDKTTAVNITHHSYFNLNPDDSPIGNHQVFINGNHILEQDSDFVTTGKLLPVAGTAHNFTGFKQVHAEWNPADGYDQTFELVKQDINTLAAATYVHKDDVQLQVYTNQPTVHFYTGRWIPNLTGKNGAQYGPYSGLCFETQVHPNAVNRPVFPNTILEPGETYHHQTIYKIIA